jgi:hypothetical protein
MGTDDSTSTTRVSQMTPMSLGELVALAGRLRNRAESVVLRDCPHQQADLRAAAQVIDQLLELHAEIRATAALTDRLSRLLDLVGGA